MRKHQVKSVTELEAYYNKFNEEKRLDSRHGRVEFVTSMHYIHQCLEEVAAGREKEEISIDDFAKIDLRVATILTAERVPKTDKLMKLSVKIGDEERTIVSGIAQHYTEEQLVGRNVIVIANLKAAKLRGIESRGMLLAASDGKGNLVLADAPGIASGSKVK